MGLNELARALSQSIAAEPLAGLAGIYGTATGGSGEGVRLIDKVREKVGYQPQTKEGIRNLDALARALSPVNNALEKARTTLGDGAFNATGSPALAAAAYTAPDAILSALGARPAMAAGRSAQAGIGRAVRRATELPAPAMGSPASQLGIFAGRNAKTADHGAMQRAAARLAAGDDPRVVWREEGWMKGPDGHMRFEIDDSGASRVNAVEENKPAGWYPKEMGEAFRHPDLYAAYDDLAARPFAFEMAGNTFGEMRGAYWPESDRFYVGGPREEQLSTAAHELQHGVQKREGFARGGDSGQFNQQSTPYSPRQAYQRLAGEAEARAVQKRLDYTPEQRRAIYPLDDYDVPLDELIFRAFAR